MQTIHYDRMLYFGPTATGFRFLITFSLNIKQEIQKNKRFYSYPPSPSFFVLSPLRFLKAISRWSDFHKSLPFCIFHLVFGIFFSHPPSPLPNFLLIFLLFFPVFFHYVFLLSSLLYCILSLFSTIYYLCELFFPCMLLLLPFLVAFL
jgi:hypothetical protein